MNLGGIPTREREVYFHGGEKYRAFTVPFIELSIDFAKVEPEQLLAEISDEDKIGLATKIAEYKQVECYNCLYAIGPVAGYPMKIGITDRIKSRLSSIQTGSWQELKLFGLLWGPGPSAYCTEQRVLSDAKRTGLHERGEWIATTPVSLIDMVIDAAKAVREPLMTSAMAIENKGRMMLAMDANIPRSQKIQCKQA